MHLSSYPEVNAALADEPLMAAMASVRAVVRLGHQARSTAGVKRRQPLAEVIVATDDANRRDQVGRHVDLIAGELASEGSAPGRPRRRSSRRSR